VIEAGEIREIQHTGDTQLLPALFLAASSRLTDSQSSVVLALRDGEAKSGTLLAH
jgi:hypothetical protein